MLNLSRVNSKSSCFNLDINFEAEDLYSTNVATAVLNSVFSLTAILGNLTIIMAYKTTPSLHCPANTLLCCLALSDFTVGLIAQPCFVAHKIGEIQRNLDIYCATRIISETSGFITSGVSILTLTAISIERYLAMYLHLRYKELVTNFRVFLIVGTLWITIGIMASLRFLFKDGREYNAVTVPILFSSLIITVVAYTGIYKHVKRHHRSIEDQESTKSSRNILRFKKSTVTMAYILILFVISNAPFIGVAIAHRFEGYTYSVKTAYIYVSSCIFICSSVNPVIYCWRIAEIRRAVAKLLKIFTCRRNHAQIVANDSVFSLQSKYQ